MRVCEEQGRKKLTWSELEAGEVFLFDDGSDTYCMRVGDGYVWLGKDLAGSVVFEEDEGIPVIHYPNACIKLGEPAS